MSLLNHSSHLYAIALNPLIGATVKDTIENVTLYLGRLGRAYSDALQEPSISMVTDTAVAALLYETQRLNGSAVREE